MFKNKNGTFVGIPLGALLALTRFPGRRVLVVAVNALLGLPPVVVGLAMYLLLSNAGPLGFLHLLFTPAAMVLAQAILATPIVAALAHRVLEARWAEFGRAFQASGASCLQALPHLLAMSRRPLTTAVALETNKGNLELALSLGLVLIGISVTVSSTVLVLGEGRQ